MKRIVALVIVLMMVFPFAAVPAMASGSVTNGSEYDGVLTGHWDALVIDGETEVGSGVQIMSYMVNNDFLLEEKANTLTIRGWAACDQEIEAFGYQINDDEPVFKAEFAVETEQPVFDAAEGVGASSAGRFVIDVDVSGLKGRNKIAAVIKTPGGNYSISLVTNFDLEFDFLQEGTDTEATPTPEAGENTPKPIIVRFDSFDKTDDFFAYSTGNSLVPEIDYDEDKNCAVFTVTGGPDPNVKLPVGLISMDEDLGFFGPVSAADYKAIVLVGRFDYDSILNDPEKAVIGTFYFTTDESTEFSESKNVIYNYEKSDELQYVIVDLSRNKLWKGEAGDCRFDFFATTDNDCTYEFYLFGFFANKSAAESFVNEYKAGGDSILPTPEPTPEPTATPEATEAPEVTDAPEATEEPETETAEPEATSEPEKKGCGGVIAVIPAIAVVLAGAVISAVKKKD